LRAAFVERAGRESGRVRRFILDVICGDREGTHMSKPLLLAAAASAALFALSACNNEPEVVNGLPGDPQAEALRNAPPVEAPPMITASKQYRCADNSLYVVEFYSNNSATLRVGNAQAAATILQAGEGGNPPYAGTGYTVSGNGDRVTINGKSCHT
jgi:hypothetical protein